MTETGAPPRVVAITRATLGRVIRWRGVRSGTRTYLHACIDGEWYQVVETRSDPECLPPRGMRRRAGEYTWLPAGQRGVYNEE